VVLLVVEIMLPASLRKQTRKRVSAFKALVDVIIKGVRNDGVVISKVALRVNESRESTQGGAYSNMDVMGDHSNNNMIFIPDVLIDSRGMRKALKICEP
jgi:hypothetical protein